MNDNSGGLSNPWYTKSKEQAMEDLCTSEDGLCDQEAAKRLSTYGANELRQKQRKTFGKMLLEQITDVMVLILVAAAVLSMFLGEWAEAVVIFAIVVIDAVIGVVQERKATSAL